MLVFIDYSLTDLQAFGHHMEMQDTQSSFVGQITVKRWLIAAFVLLAFSLLWTVAIGKTFEIILFYTVEFHEPAAVKIHM